jgi:hypothetical protein
VTRPRLKTVVAGILVAGFAASIVIYVTASGRRPNPLGYDPEDTKIYVRDMELYGGRANMLASDIRQWFSGLWHGRKLALTIAVLTAVAASLVWLLGQERPAEDGTPDDPSPPV